MKFDFRNPSLIFCMFFAHAALAKAQCNDLATDIFLETSPVKDQCATGSCWAHPATSVQENRIRVRTGKDISISEEFYYIQRVTNRARTAMLATTKGSGMLTVTDLIAKTFQASTPERAMELGAVPDVVAPSKLISTSRDEVPLTIKNAMFRRVADVFREFNLGFRAHAGDPKMVRQVLAKATEQLKAIEAEYQERVPGKWREGPSGAEFEFEGEWYTPKSFQQKFVFGGKEPAFGNAPESIAQIDAILTRALEAKDTVALRMSWDDNAWFLANYGKARSRHALELVGVKRHPDGSIKSYIIKNSYGAKWKEGGHLEIPHGEFHKALRDINYLNALHRVRSRQDSAAVLIA